MKILHTADLHLGKMLNGYSLIEDQKYIIKKIEDIIINENVDTVVVAGDIFDRAITTQEALDLFCDFLDFIYKNNKYLIAIIGNHDGSRITFTNNILKHNNIYIIDEPKKIKIEDVAFSCIPYLNIHEFKDYYNEDFKSIDEAYMYAIDDLGTSNGYYNVMVAHDYFTHNMEKLIESDSEIKNMVGGLEYLDVSMFKDYDYTALGHMHNAQKVGLDKIRYSGSILKYSFSEANHDKSVVIIDSNSNSFTLVPLIPKRDLVDIKGTLNELVSPEFYSKYNYKEDYFRAILPNTEVDAYQALKAIYPNLMEIKIEDTNEELILERKIVKEQNYLELFNMFYEEITKEKMNNEESLIIKDYLDGGAK